MVHDSGEICSWNGYESGGLYTPTRTYVKADVRGDPRRRRHQVGSRVVFNKRDAIVVSHDRYYWSTGTSRGVDAMYTIRFSDSGRTRSWMQSGMLVPVVD